MIDVIFISCNGFVKEITIKGHANSNKNEEEKDLVCAGVSAVVTGILNSLEDDKLKIKVNNGFVNIKVIDNKSKKNQLIFNVLKTSLLTIEEENGKFIKINQEDCSEI